MNPLRSPANWPDYPSMGTVGAPDVEITMAEYAVARQCIRALDGLNQDALYGGWNFKDSEAAARALEIERDRLQAENASLTDRQRKALDLGLKAARENEALREANAGLAAALEDCLTFLKNDCLCNNSRPEQNNARAALKKHQGATNEISGS